MTDKLMALLAYAVMAASLIILVWYVPRWDLGGVVLATLILAGIDVFQVLRDHQKPGHETRTNHDPRDDL
ncbi:hypothetical protein FNJ84_02675 [Paracoccus sp. M683]|uniref:hypothetical protein n=1 Tax=Paracoccus sp. M683 TaxID=2594268 RepID=UPI0011808BB6|nr:hypothetical protein [Paracoccus sp. M683]TRW99599.1 hypothetical protein FNJ84_02675 [Paracoccus sp. M683]